MSETDRIYDVLCCPLCDYMTGVNRQAWGLAAARGALVSHLVRKRNGLTRPAANVLAKQQTASRARWNGIADELIHDMAPREDGQP
jgi:hypothetical protein